MTSMNENSIAAIVTDPPYGVKEYTQVEIQKKRDGQGGIWRRPQCFDGHVRQPVPRFSVINDDPKERRKVFDFFVAFAELAYPILTPGGHVFIASTPLLSDIVSTAMRQIGFERRGEIIRTVCTLRGGDRPKGAEREFDDVSVIPRGLWEPWGLYRKPLAEKTVAENLRVWSTGALRRERADIPFSDIIDGGKVPAAEREIADHPSIKPQSFLRKIVYAALPVGKGIVFDPFAGSGSTLAAAEHYSYDSIGTEINADFYKIGESAIPKLAALYPKQLLLRKGRKGWNGNSDFCSHSDLLWSDRTLVGVQED
ncbi:MAG: DNA-methyltransferase [Thermoguttaceae bacterium]